MIRIAITAVAFEAVARTLPFGSVAYEPQLNAKGERLVWLEAAMVDRLGAMRRRGESYSSKALDAVLRFIEALDQCRTSSRASPAPPYAAPGPSAEARRSPATGPLRKDAYWGGEESAHQAGTAMRTG